MGPSNRVDMECPQQRASGDDAGPASLITAASNRGANAARVSYCTSVTLNSLGRVLLPGSTLEGERVSRTADGWASLDAQAETETMPRKR